MRKDLVENIQPGSAQHFGENALALAKFLSASPTLLPSLEQGFKKPAMVFFSNMGVYASYSFFTAKILFALTVLATLAVIPVVHVNYAPALKRSGGVWTDHFKGVGVVVVSGLGALIGANVVAVVMQRVLGRGMSWFSSELSCLGLYGPAAFTGMYISAIFWLADSYVLV